MWQSGGRATGAEDEGLGQWQSGLGQRVGDQHMARSFSLSLSLLVSGSRAADGHNTSGAGGAGRRKGLSPMRLGGLRGSRA